MQQDRDQIHRFIFDNTDIRGEIVTLSKSFDGATQHQHLPLWCKKLLGEFLTAVSLLSETLKFDGILTLQARGSGALPLVMAETDNLGHIRGIIKPSDQTNDLTDIENMPLPELIGKGVLVLTMDPKSGKRYQGIVPLEQPTLALCLSDYFERSEQLKTKFTFFSDENICSGMLLQALPAQKQTDPQQREEDWQTAIQLMNTLKHEEIVTLEHKEMLYRLFHEMACRIFSGKTIQFSCQCSHKRSANAISSLGLEDAQALIKEQGTIDINCDFCGKTYHFNNDDLPAIFGEGTPPIH